MKKLKYTLIALLVLCMTGCNESSFLEEDPRASLYPETVSYTHLTLPTNSLV